MTLALAHPLPTPRCPCTAQRIDCPAAPRVPHCRYASRDRSTCMSDSRLLAHPARPLSMSPFAFLCRCMHVPRVPNRNRNEPAGATCWPSNSQMEASSCMLSHPPESAHNSIRTGEALGQPVHLPQLPHQQIERECLVARLEEPFQRTSQRPFCGTQLTYSPLRPAERRYVGFDRSVAE